MKGIFDSHAHYFDARFEGEYEGGADATNLTQLVQTSLDSMTKLATAVGEAYAKIAGGAQADTALDVAAKVVNYFKSSGGDAEKATVTTDTATSTLTEHASTKGWIMVNSETITKTIPNI